MAKNYVVAGASSAYGTTTTNGLKVKSSGETTVLAGGKEAYGITHDAVNANADKLLGKKVTVGVNVTEAYTNGTASTGSSMTFTFDPTASIKGGSMAGKYMTLTSTDGEERTYTARDRAQAAGSVTITNYVNITPTSTYSSATFTFGDTEFDDTNNETITLIDHAGLSRTYVCKNDYGASSALEWNAGASASASAANFKIAVEASTGHNGTLAVAVVDGAVTITAATATTAGNTTISHSAGFDALCDVNPPAAFAGGLAGGVHTVAITTSDGTVITATSSATTTTSTNTNTPTFQVVTSNDATAANLATCLNANSKLISTSDTNVTTIKQALAGTAGNTAITLADPETDGMTKVDFTGGTGAALTENEFDVGDTATETALLFKARVEEAIHGHGTARFTIAPTGGLLLITQAVAGEAGDTVITTDFDTIASVNPPSYFSGGGVAVTPNLVAQFSHNGNDWGGDVELTSNIEANETGVKLFSLDLTDMIVPYMRLVFNQANATINSVGKHESFYVHR